MSRNKNFSIKAYLPRTLFARSLLILIMPVILIQVITTYVFFDRHWSKMTTRLAFAVAGEIRVIAQTLEGEEEYADDLVSYYDRDLELKVDYREGERLSDPQSIRYTIVWQNMVAQTLADELKRALGNRPFSLDMDFDKKWVQIDVQLDNGVMGVFLPRSRLFSSSGYIFLLWMFGTSVVLLVIAILFMRNQIRPIKKLAVAAERFGRGREVAMFRPQGATEVRMAGEAFLDMHKRITRQIEQRTAMLAGVSHDLRTPLTRLKLQMAMLGDSPDIVEMQADIQEMEKMIEGYIDFVRGDGEESMTMISLKGLVDKIAGAAKRQGIDTTSTIEKDINISVRRMAFERCLSNIVNNAGKYAQHVWIGADIDDENKLTIVIEDDGPGIPEEQYDDVFKPFYRVDSSRSTETGGVGLGLPIAMDIVHSHGGKIWLDKSLHGGLKVSIKLPL